MGRRVGRRVGRAGRTSGWCKYIRKLSNFPRRWVASGRDTPAAATNARNKHRKKQSALGRLSRRKPQVTRPTQAGSAKVNVRAPRNKKLSGAPSTSRSINQQTSKDNENDSEQRTAFQGLRVNVAHASSDSISSIQCLRILTDLVVHVFNKLVVRRNSEQARKPPARSACLSTTRQSRLPMGVALYTSRLIVQSTLVEHQKLKRHSTMGAKCRGVPSNRQMTHDPYLMFAVTIAKPETLPAALLK